LQLCTSKVNLVCEKQKEQGQMALAVTDICILVLLALAIVWARRRRIGRELERHSVTPETLHSSLASNQEILVFDVRQPLDLLAYPEIIPGAQRIPPNDVLKTPGMIPKDKDAVVYCTCPGDKTSREVFGKARAQQLLRVKFLKGGLAGWKAMGYPVEPYREVFNLYAGAATPPA
jgi:rhodanese-related sulfurtransferase